MSACWQPAANLVIIETDMKLICYCHGYTEADIIADIKRNKGKSSILQQIKEARKNNTCRCDEKHPQKR
jgi:hypothetical protein